MEGRKTGGAPYASYEDWYKDMTLLTQNKEVYKARNFVLLRKVFDEYYRELLFVSKLDDPDYKEEKKDFVIEGFEDFKLWEEADVLLLHPTKVERNLEMKKVRREADEEEVWQCSDVTKDFYHGDQKSALALLIRNHDYLE